MSARDLSAATHEVQKTIIEREKKIWSIRFTRIKKCQRICRRKPVASNSRSSGFAEFFKLILFLYLPLFSLSPLSSCVIGKFYSNHKFNVCDLNARSQKTNNFTCICRRYMWWWTKCIYDNTEYSTSPSRRCINNTNYYLK